ncbi:hypothetical protein COL5a_007273 [Colletotrichum fioriniae]|uniref:uncharacterized protein n=1 Tax=Colletotrichum fioriniae TaxID=710243 RepID=UPI002301AB71|nr:uncharacterized protein COL516b_005181 [Colletotrichum fioriniae]KAJ0305487.1 hypothetical protein COL516b_005181 [Colletotrichum fioriniae]KAJ0325764.1 hypothetical protein COL5a_007273 [Colletotrichum fioriniae]KAJ3938712.1 hypothetical protein N0V96_011444 [Colletotrichum fioriniae]
MADTPAPPPHPTSGPATEPAAETVIQPASQPASPAATSPEAEGGSTDPPAQVTVAGDDTENETDASSLQSGLTATTNESQASVTPSIFDYRLENGRSYHRLSDGSYLVPNDETEQERLDIANHLWLIAWDGKFCLCPKNQGAKRVLDLGTGTGVWSILYADAFQGAEVLGVDLSPIQPEFVPPNCYFEVDDLEKEWTWTTPFDFIFARNMAGSFQDWAKVIAQAFRNLEPGGYFEIHDNLYPLECDDGTLKEDSALFQWSKYLVEATDKIGRPITIASKLDKMLEEAGFVDVVVTKQVMPASPWAKDEKLNALGVWTSASLLPGIEGLCLALFTRVLDWDPNEVIAFCSSVRKDAKNLGIHAYWYGYSIYGRKPFLKEGEEEAAQN